MTKHFARWAAKQNITLETLATGLEDVRDGNFDANLGGHIFKKRIRFQGRGKSWSGRTIICYQYEDRAIFIHGFTKNEKSNLTEKELNGFKELAKILLNLSRDELNIAIKNGDLMEV